jgi:hypothetical protein
MADLGAPVDRVLGWLEYIPRLIQRQKRKKILLDAFEGANPEHRWLTLGLLTRRLGLNDQKNRDLNETASLLVSLPNPGPARPDTKGENRSKPRQQQLWGLTTVVGK